MRILIIGGDGMLGHRLFQSWRGRHEVTPTLRRERGAYPTLPADLAEAARYGIDLASLETLAELLVELRPELVVNAAGLVKQRAESHEALPSLQINSLFPHRLAQLCRLGGARMVHLSTDCVFSGRKGNYTEEDLPDPPDLYGRSKLLGEVEAPGCLTLRTSMIGLELGRRSSLVEWFLAQRGPIRGFTRARFSGFITSELARAIEHLVTQPDPVEGRWHLAMAPISKYDLLQGLKARLGLALEIERDETFTCDRSLDASALYARTTYRPPSWEASLDELAAEIRDREARP